MAFSEISGLSLQLCIKYYKIIIELKKETQLINVKTANLNLKHIFVSNIQFDLGLTQPMVNYKL